MEGHMDGDRNSTKRARAEDTVRRGPPAPDLPAHDRPAGAEADPRLTPRDEGARRERPGLGTAPTGVPDTSTPPPPDMGTVPSGSEPAKAAAFGLIGALILILGLLALPFFIFSIVIAAPLALVILIIAAVFLAARTRGPWSTSDR